MEGPQFRQELSQQLKLCPQLMQNIALLQMNVQDLREFLNAPWKKTRCLNSRKPSGDAFRELSARNEWMRTSSDAPPEPGAEDRELTSRESFLRDQLARRKLPPKLLSLCTYLIELLDEDGFLPQRSWSICITWGFRTPCSRRHWRQFRPWSQPVSRPEVCPSAS